MYRSLLIFIFGIFVTPLAQAHVTNLIRNGNFDQGAFGFTTNYRNVQNDIWGEGTFAIVRNPRFVHPHASSYSDNTHDSAALLMAVNGSTLSNQEIWSQTVNVVSDSYYTFQAYVSSWVSSSPATLQFNFSSASASSPQDYFASYRFTAPSTTSFWAKVQDVVHIPNLSQIRITIYDTNTSGGGNDFALDDIGLYQGFPSTVPPPLPPVPPFPLPVPEPEEWITMLLGFAMLSFQIKRKMRTGKPD